MCMDGQVHFVFIIAMLLKYAFNSKIIKKKRKGTWEQ